MLTLSKGRHRAALATLFLALWAGSLQAAERVGDFALLDQQGRFHHMSWYDDHKAIAFLVQVNGSQQTAQAAAEYARLQSAFDSQGIEFMMINPLGEDRASVKQAVTDVVEKTGGEDLDPKEVQESVQKAVKEAVRERVQEIMNEAGEA